MPFCFPFDFCEDVLYFIQPTDFGLGRISLFELPMYISLSSDLMQRERKRQRRRERELSDMTTQHFILKEFQNY